MEPDLKKFSSDFKEVYNAPNETAALTELENMKEKWGKKYPYAISNWENNWEDVSSFFQFSNDIRRIMYTTNIIEGLNRQYRKVTKTKSVFPSDSALEKMLYLASENVVKKWTQRYRKDVYKRQDCFMAAPVGSESHHLTIKHWLEYCFQYPAQCFLYQLVFITVDTKWPHLPDVYKRQVWES